jgi:hypothetical membrane protein
MTVLTSSMSAETESAVSERLAGLAFAVLAAQFMTVIMLAASMAPVYDVRGGAISDLGVIPETAWLFNASLVLTGILNALAGYFLFRARGGLTGLVFALLAGLGAIGAGLIPLGTNGWHGLFALFAFVFFNVQTLITAWRLNGAMRVVGLALGALGIGYVAVMAIGDAGNPAIFGAIGHGGAERMIVYPPMLWLMIFGGYLMAQPARR